MFFIFALPYCFQYRVLLNKIDQIEKSYVKPIHKADLISASFSELLKDLPERDQKIFLIKSLKWLEKHHPKTHQCFLQKTLTGLSKPLDAYSTYLSPKNFKNTIRIGQGRVAGIGIELFEKNGMVEVVGIMANSPAMKAKLKVGDLITHVDHTTIEPKKDSIIQKLRGNIGSYVSLTIQRQDCVFNVDICREMIKIQAIITKIFKGILYIRINYFTEHTHQEIKNLLIKYPHIKGCILDVRNNPGGLFKEGVLVSELFLDKGIKILEMRGQNIQKSFYTQSIDYLQKKPLVILINQATASSSELVAACLKDAKRALLIGKNTLGKGTIQDVVSVFPSSIFGGFKYTTAEFLTCAGNAIQNKGVEPNIHINGEICFAVHPEILYKTDAQFKKGIDLILK